MSSNPSIVGNAQDKVYNNPNYVVVGMLGQVEALVSAENGPISVGDSLTSASFTPGYAMRAAGGDSTVGVALEPLSIGTGKIKVLISRRNKSLAVEEIEALVVERIANMKIEDQVQQMIKQAVDNLNLDPKIAQIAQEEAGKLDRILSIKFDDVSGQISNFQFLISNKISNLNDQMNALANSFHITDSQGEAIFSGSRAMGALPNREVAITADNILLNGNVGLGTTTVSSLCLGGVCRSSWDEIDNLINNFQFSIFNFQTIFNNQLSINSDGNLVIGRTASSSAASIAQVQIIDPMEIVASSSQTALVVNQAGSGDLADFQSSGVSIVNIAQTGEVKIMGSLLVDGRIMLCSGSFCSNALDAAVDETRADLGVEGKVVAGAFEGYCEDGYVWVPGSAKYGTLPGFCVMADIAGVSAETPLTPLYKGGNAWTNVSQGEAQYACQSLGAGYHLIGENEWLTIAENILRVSGNDTDANTAGLQLGSSTTFKLTNDNVINNLVGDIAEWTSQNITAAGLPITPATNSWFEYNEVVDYKGLNIVPAYYLTDLNNYIGKIYIGAGTGLKGFVRGSGGIYGLDLSHTPSEKSTNIGFRCAK